MAKAKRLWTLNEVLALNEACRLRLELIDGRLLKPVHAPPSWELGLRTWVEELRAAGHEYLVEER